VNESVVTERKNYCVEKNIKYLPQKILITLIGRIYENNNNPLDNSFIDRRKIGSQWERADTTGRG